MSFRKVVMAIILAVPCAAMGKPGPAAGLDGDDPGACTRNCVSMWRSNDYLLLAARDASGRVFKTMSLELAPDAHPVAARPAATSFSGRDLVSAASAGDSPGALCMNMPGVCTETAVMRYASPTQYIIYTFTYVFSNGNLVEVRVDETRVARSKID